MHDDGRAVGEVFDELVEAWIAFLSPGHGRNAVRHLRRAQEELHRLVHGDYASMDALAYALAQNRLTGRQKITQ